METGEIKQHPLTAAVATVLEHLEGIDLAVKSVGPEDRAGLIKLVQPVALRTFKALVPVKQSRNGRRLRA